MNAVPQSHASLRVSRHPCLITGGLVGMILAATAVSWVLVANRMPAYDRWAEERNLAAAIGIGLLLLVPVVRFLKSPTRIFLSGIFAWTIFSLTYAVMTGSFPRLESRMGAFHVFMLGAVVNALLATIVWVLQMLLQARQQTFVPARRRLP